MGNSPEIIVNFPENHDPRFYLIRIIILGSPHYNENTEIKFGLVDFRKWAGDPRKCGGIQQEEMDGDPEGYIFVNLGDYSEFTGVNEGYQKFGVTNCE